MENQQLEYLREKTLLLPQESGVYKMLNKSGGIIYIGKAKSLKNRVGSYFRSVEKHQPKVYKMVENVFDFDYIVTDSEFEALVLECSLIKLHSPKYNILLKDDKGYCYIKVEQENFGKIYDVKKKEEDGQFYFGPYLSNMVARETVDEAVKAFGLPTCNKKFPRDFRKGRPCLNYHLKQCMGVCTGKIDAKTYNEAKAEAVEFIKQGGVQSIEQLTIKMEAAAEVLDFYKAARYRDRIAAIRRLGEQQKVVYYNHKSLDVVAAVQGGDMLYIAILVFRDGRLRDKKSFVLDFFISVDDLLEGFLLSYYTNHEDVPKEIFLDREMVGQELVADVISSENGRKLSVTVPQRGQSLQLIEMARNNAAQELSRKTNRSGKEISAVDQLGKILGLAASPMYIEAYDISNIGGQTIVGGMVVFEKGRPSKKMYKKFNIKDMHTPDDYGSMDQMLTRRFNRFLDSEEKDVGFKTKPDLLLIDGGMAHVNVAKSVLSRLGLDIPVFGMVKDNKHRTKAISPGGSKGEGSEEIVIGTNRSVFALVTKIQDEVHRYSIEFSRSRHIKSSLETRLLAVPNIGSKRANILYKHFKTYKAICDANVEQLAEVEGMSRSSADSLYKYLHLEE